MYTSEDQLELSALIERSQHHQETAAYADRLQKSQELNELLITWGLVLCGVCFLVSAWYAVKAIRGRTKWRHGRRVTA
jgi:hypothetical protein